MKRRDMIVGLLTLGAAGCGPRGVRRAARVHRRAHRRRRRRVRRRIRRRIRRRMVWRTVGPRRVAVIPRGVVVGWELQVGPDEYVIVREVRSPKVIVVAYPSGRTVTWNAAQEDNSRNAEVLKGSQVKVTEPGPYKEYDEEVEVEDEE